MSTKTTAVARQDDIQSLIKDMRPAFQMALGSERFAERFTRVALTLLRGNPKLAQSSQPSLLGSLMQAAQLSLDFGLGEAYLVPYWSEKLKSYECTFQIGYQGYVDLFYRHPLAQEVYAEPVYSKDEFTIVKGTERRIHHVPDLTGDRGELIGFYAVARLRTGAFNFDYMSKAEMDKHRDRFARMDKKGGNNFWDNHYEAMAQKTVVKRVLKLMPKSIDMSLALEIDGTIKRPITMEEAKNIDTLKPIYVDIDSEPETPKDEGQEIELADARSMLIDRLKELPIKQKEKDDMLIAITEADSPAAFASIASQIGIMEAGAQQ